MLKMTYSAYKYMPNTLTLVYLGYSYTGIVLYILPSSYNLFWCFERIVILEDSIPSLSGKASVASLNTFSFTSFASGDRRFTVNQIMGTN